MSRSNQNYVAYGYLPFPPSFRSLKKQPVAGGRWSVRKTTRENKPWRAWTRGTAVAFSRHFETHEEAVAHAQRIALIHALNAEAKKKNKLAR